jgi:hypothetical protein
VDIDDVDEDEDDGCDIIIRPPEPFRLIAPIVVVVGVVGVVMISLLL